MYRFGDEELQAVKRVFDSKEFYRVGSRYQEVDNFEKELADKMGVDYALFLGGGTIALIAGLIGLGVGPGDEVIVPGYTFMASALAVTAVGAIPVIAEIDETLVISPDDIEKKISPNTKAIMPVHMIGFPCDMDRIMEIAEKHNILVIEDACQAVGGSYKSKRLGSIGHVGALSFNYFKIISCGEGGAVLTNSKDAFERAVYLHDGGSVFRQDYIGLAKAQNEEFSYTDINPIYSEFRNPVFAGIQSRQSEINGAIMRVQLKRLDGILADLRRAKKVIMDAVADSGIQFLKTNDEGDCATHLGFIFDDEKTARCFAESQGVGGSLPIDSGRHVYTNWEPIMNKRGSAHDRTNPFKLEANQGLNFNYSEDMCPDTLDILSRVVCVAMNPDWTGEEIQEKISSINTAAKAL